MNKNIEIPVIPQEKFRFVNEGERLSDKKLDDKPIGYFHDAWNRFKKNKASVTAAVIIILIVLFAFIAPLVITTHDSSLMVSYYAKKAPRVAALRPYGICDGGVDRNFSEKGLIAKIAIGMAAEDKEGKGGITLEQGMASEYQPMMEIGDSYIVLDGKKKEQTYYNATIDTYLEVGFKYYSVEQAEYQNILAWQEETGLQVIYPLIDTKSQYCADENDANAWYKTKKNNPVTTASGKAKEIPYAEGMVLEDNYKRDSEGNVLFYEYTGGGTFETAQYRIRVLYYNYYQYLYGSEPDYIMGTDSQGYDFAIRLANGIKLSLLLAVTVSVINFLIGTAYGAVEGYYGGWVDLVLERVSDILYNVPFIIVATLFQQHLAKKVGPVPSLIFAFVLTGWLGTAYRVRTQFYRFKNQEYVMAARTLGARDSRIIWKHIFPNSLGTIITSCALVIPGVISSESMLSFLGIVKLGTGKVTSLGTLLADASAIWTNYPHLMIFPAMIISLLMISFNLFGNGLRDAFNPSLRGVED